MNNILPELNKKFFCIVNRKSVTLAALISSYVYEKGYYTTFLECSEVNIPRPDEIIDEINKDSIGVQSLTQLDTKAFNALNMISECKYLILAGLDENQKSYFSFLDDYNVLEIQTVDEVDYFLDPLVDKNNYFDCNEQHIAQGLYLANKNNSKLRIDNSVDEIRLLRNQTNGIIIIEDIDSISKIIAVNYSISFNSDILIIPEVKIDQNKAESLIKNWKLGNETAYIELQATIYDPLDGINFSTYEFATFFTIGMPYSLILNNIIPITQVHLFYNPDFLIFNNLYYEHNYKINSAVVFSPQMYLREETEYIIDKLHENKYNVKRLIGNNANAHNLDLHIRDFPYNLLHICSHGGEIDGFEIIEEFTDRKGEEHTVKYDEVVTFGPSPHDDLIRVVRKYIIRELDGLDYRRDKEEKYKYPPYVFEDLHRTIQGVRKANRTPKPNIANSCSISCIGSAYQAMFNQLASVFSPIIFNNTCWSWHEISQAFLISGARGYIGTLWNVNNQIATDSAMLFYDNLFDETVINSLCTCQEITNNTKDQDIYIYWGLHFTSLKNGDSIAETRKLIAYQMLKQLERWKSKRDPKTGKADANIEQLIKWNAYVLSYEFKEESKSIFKVSGQ